MQGARTARPLLLKNITMKATTNKDGLQLQLTRREALQLRTLVTIAKNSKDFEFLTEETMQTALALLLTTCPRP